MTERRPPRHLSAGSKRLFSAVSGDYELDPAHFELLVAALDARDRMVAARELIAAEGLVTEGSRGQAVAHPAVAIERDARTQFAKLLGQLGLDGEGGRAA